MSDGLPRPPLSSSSPAVASSNAFLASDLHHHQPPPQSRLAWHSLRLPVQGLPPSQPKDGGSTSSSAAAAPVYREAYSLGGLRPDSSYEAK